MLEVITINDNRWDSIVKTFENYDVYYLSGYAKSFQIHGDGEPLLFYYEDYNCRGINVVMKRDIALNKNFIGKILNYTYFDFSTPYGYGGWLIEGNNPQNLFHEYEKWCIENNIISEFVRFHPVINNHVCLTEYYQIISLGKTVAIDTRDKELIWKNFNPKNRNVIRKAINNGIQIKQGLSKELLELFMDIYNQTMDKDNAEEYYYFKNEYYECILNDLKENATIFYAELNGKVIAASIMIYANRRLNYHLSGSLREYQNLAPSNMLLWKAAEWGNISGCLTFHLGGGVGSADDSLLHFKKAFYRGELCTYFIGKKIFNEEKYNELVTLRKNIENKGFFPEYRG